MATALSTEAANAVQMRVEANMNDGSQSWADTCGATFR